MHAAVVVVWKHNTWILVAHLLRQGTAAVWFDTLPVFGFAADNGKWIHPSHDCGRDDVPVPAAEERHPMWNAPVECRDKRLQPEVGSKHPCHLDPGSKWVYAKSL